ncbi:PREDICTED: putative odorant receptor 65c [Drosophila arizonae]|uniref:Odorant receptor n=1 Tax=Drosophila arizonae TaxID=7263 RepID=A0ABM1P0E0_DROAR|nr:PREDICTED: putative odorant receptor 65c [Drosophila arizonae]
MRMSYSIPQTGWRRIYEQFVDYWMVLHEKTHPQHTTLYYNRLQLIVMCNYPNKEQRRSPIRHLWHRIILLQTNLFFVTLLFALPESVDNIVDFGQNILWLISCFYLAFKWHYFYFRADDVDEIINDVDECHCMAVSGAAAPIIRSEQRRFFLIESSLTLAWYVGNTMFIILTTSQPLWTGQKLPFNAVYPFEWHDPEKHPIAHAIIYIWQFYFLAYNLAINFKILCIELDTFAKLHQEDEEQFRSELGRLIKLHQRAIRNVHHVNEVFYAPLTMQMLTQFLLISLSTFETLAAKQDLRVATSFIIFMLLTFCHCAYFCYFGDMVTEYSNQVAQSAYGAFEWSPNSRVIRRDLLFMISRAQKPLAVTPSPLPPFNRITFMSVIKQCYTILTLLMESMD